MCRVKARIIANGVERLAQIKKADGTVAQVVVNGCKAGKHHIFAAEIHRDKNRVLVELPQESTTGDWRIWVSKAQLLQT